MNSNFPNIKEKVVPYGPNILVYEEKSPFQLIRLHKNGQYYWLSLNGTLQFHTADCYRLHGTLSKYPLTLLKNKPQDALIVGGGDGLLAKELLNYIPKVTQVELDPSMLKLARTHPVMRSLSDDSLNNPRVEVIAGDGIKYLKDSKKKYDLIIDDCDFTITNQPGTNKPGIDDTKNYEDYLKCLTTKLKPGGISLVYENILSSYSGEPLSEYINEQLAWLGKFAPHIRYTKINGKAKMRDTQTHKSYFGSTYIICMHN